MQQHIRPHQSKTMVGRNVCLVALIAGTMQMAAVHSTTAASSTVCTRAKECYMNGWSSRVCDRTERQCGQCLEEKESDPFLSSAGVLSEFNCFDVDDNGNCPSGTTQCDTKTFTARTTQTESSTQSSSTRRTISPSSDPSDSTTETTPSARQSSSSSQSRQRRDNSTTSTTRTPRTSNPGTDVRFSSLNTDNSGKDASDVRSPTRSVKDPDSKPSQSTRNSDGDEQSPATVSPPRDVPSSVKTEELGDKSSTGAGNMSRIQSQPGFIMGIVAGAVAIVAFAGFVIWKKKRNDEDSDDEDGAFSPSKPSKNGIAASQPSVTSSTAYAQQPKYLGSNTYKHRYNTYGNDGYNNYGNNGYNANYGNNGYNVNFGTNGHNDNYGNNGYNDKYSGNSHSTKHSTKSYEDNLDESGFSVNCCEGATASQYAASAGIGVLLASYESPPSMDESDLRRTDSILGGTGIMSSTRSVQNPFDCTGGSSSSSNNDLWGNEMDSFREKNMASNMSVEF